MSPASAPTERSICPATITSTMPVARMDVTAIWRASSERLRGERNMPSVAALNAIQIRASAPTIVRVRHAIGRRRSGVVPAPGAARSAAITPPPGSPPP